MGNILKAGQKYTFSDYFELNNPTREILEEFGYQYYFEELVLPKTTMAMNHLDRLRQTYINKLPLISLTGTGVIEWDCFKSISYIPTGQDFFQ